MEIYQNSGGRKNKAGFVWWEPQTLSTVPTRELRLHRRGEKQRVRFREIGNRANPRDRPKKKEEKAGI